MNTKILNVQRNKLAFYNKFTLKKNNFNNNIIIETISNTISTIKVCKNKYGRFLDQIP